VPGPFERPQVIAAGLAFDARVGRRHVAAGNCRAGTTSSARW
jgi:hypothetical protein